MSESIRLLQRDPSIDFLRFIGISLIILAHVSPSGVIFELRSFDVPLMIFISGLTLSDKKVSFNVTYFIKRIKRLLLPVYLFLTIYFLIIAAVQLLGFDLGVTSKHIIDSYLLLEGIGFVWIIRVMLCIALLTPLLKFLTDRFTLSAIIVFCLSILLIADYCANCSVFLNNIILRDYLLYGMVYSVPFIIALKIHSVKTANVVYIVGILLLLMLVDYIYLNESGRILSFISFNGFKYPPQSYFILYGLVCSLILYLIICRSKQFISVKWLEIIGCNTMWIYLYHIPLIQLTGRLNMHWGVRYIVVYMLAFGLTYCQLKLVKNISNRYNLKNKLYFLKG